MADDALAPLATDIAGASDPMKAYGGILDKMGTPDKEARLDDLEQARQASSTQHMEADIAAQKDIAAEEQRGYDIEKIFAERYPTGADIKPPTYQPFTMKDISANIFPLMVMATVGGMGSRRHAIGALKSFGAMLQGADAGRKESYEAAKSQYDASMKQLKDMQAEYTRRHQLILNDHNKTMTQKINAAKLLDMEYGKYDKQMFGDDIAYLQKSIDKDHALAMTLTGTEAKIADADKRLRETLASREKSLNIGSKRLTDAGKRFLARQESVGYLDMAKMVSSRYGGAVAADMVNDIAAKYEKDGIDPASVPMEKAIRDWNNASGRQLTVRLRRVETLTQSVQVLQSRVAELKQELYGRGIKPENMTLSMLYSQIGSQKYGELTRIMNSLALEYKEAITMPGSNAQMHATVQDWENQNFNANMPLDTILGSMTGMNEEIKANTDALRVGIHEASQATLMGGEQFPPEGGVRRPTQAGGNLPPGSPPPPAGFVPQ